MAEKVFELGLVMAGAVSAGAYTAGVVDFLFEALDEYESLRNTPEWDGPRHAVRVPILTGASAGGMTSAMAALHAFRELEHVQPGVDPPAPEKNRLYSSWVTDISIERLLETTDLEGAVRQDGVLSLLCCDVLDDIVTRVFSLAPGAKTRGWIGRDDGRSLRMQLTLTNVRGVPYSFQLFGSDQPQRFGMLNHGDYYDFVVGPGAAGANATGPTELDVENFGDSGWGVFKAAALATGAFPVGLRPRMITRPDASYYATNGCVGYEDGGNRCFKPIRPDDEFAEAPYSFVAVDGGTIDNEPLELARRYLAGDALINERNGDKASKAVVLIAPFPNLAQSPPVEAKEDLRLTHLVPRLSSMLIEQARFKPDELQKAADDTIFSRYMISPTRKDNGSDEARKYPIACGALNGFSGFLHKSFRRHDYLLGRRNAQAFLRWNFALPTTNPLFQDVAINRDRWLVRNVGGKTESVAAGADRELPTKKFAPKVGEAATVEGFPIIPLTERLCASIDIGPDDQPQPDLVSLEELETRLDRRARAVVDTMVDVDLKRFTANMGCFEVVALRLGARAFAAHVATKAATDRVERALSDLKKAFV